MATTNATRMLNAVCPGCGESAIRLHLDDLDSFSCSECNEDFSVKHARGIIASWGPILKWIDAAPVAE